MEQKRSKREAKMNYEMKEALDALEAMAREYYTREDIFVASGLNIGKAQALRILARHGRFVLSHDEGTWIKGYWPENDPVEKAEKPVDRIARLELRVAQLEGDLAGIISAKWADNVAKKIYQKK